MLEISFATSRCPNSRKRLSSDPWQNKRGDFWAVPLADDFEFIGPVASFDNADGYRAMARQAGPGGDEFRGAPAVRRREYGVLDHRLGDGDARDYHPFHATRADLLRRLNRNSEAAAAYERAAAMAPNDAEREFLTRGGRTSR